MADYHFQTDWSFATTPEAVFAILEAPETWPQWWPGLQRVEKKTPEKSGIGAVRRYEFLAPFGYTLSFEMTTTELQAPRHVGGTATGDLEGAGRWELSPIPGGTHVRYLWTVKTNKAWMNLLAPLLRPVFNWNHDRLMEEAGTGLARTLGCTRLPVALPP